MQDRFDRAVYRGLLLKQNVRQVMAYLRQFPEKAELYGRYRRLFEEESYLTYEPFGLDEALNGLLFVYQKYYREVFYLLQNKDEAAERLRRRLLQVLGAPGAPPGRAF